MKKNKYKFDKYSSKYDEEKSFKRIKIYKFINRQNYNKSYIILFLIIIIIIQLIINIYFFFKSISSKYNNISFEINNNEKIEEIDSNLILPLQDRLKGVIEITFDEQKYLNGMVRKFKPKKLVEIGVSGGGTSALMLNAIKDMPDAKLYSIDRYVNWYRGEGKKSGWAIEERFSELMNKWTFYTGVNTAEVIEKIGNNIDFAYIDTVHKCPGEMINFLEILPFLKEEAIVVLHDTYMNFLANYIYDKKIINYSNNQLLCYIRGELILPSYGNEVFSRNIGGLKLYKNQKNYLKQYFLALGTHWVYMPEENDLKILRDFYIKYYGEKLVEIYDDAVAKNKKRWNRIHN